MISDISIQFCEYNRSNPDADRIYRPQGSGDYLFLLLKTPMKVYQENGILITGENGESATVSEPRRTFPHLTAHDGGEKHPEAN